MHAGFAWLQTCVCSLCRPAHLEVRWRLAAGADTMAATVSPLSAPRFLDFLAALASFLAAFASLLAAFLAAFCALIDSACIGGFKFQPGTAQ